MASAIVAAILSSLSLATLIPSDSYAFPSFARQVGRNCSYCHTLFPKLNETGRVFRSNGYRFVAEKEWKEVKELLSVPLSIEVAVEGVYEKATSSGSRTTSSDMAIEEFELLTGGALGKSGRISALAVIGVQQSDSAGQTSYSVSIKQAFIQVNDLLGPAGEGALNVKAGQVSLGLPFLGQEQRFIEARYLAEKTLGVLTRGHRVIELNGSAVTEEESWLPTHRYSAGVSRENVNGDDKMKGYYAAYSATFAEKYSLGLIYRGGEEKDGATDLAYDKWGAAAEAEIDPLLFTMAYFRSERTGLNDRDNYMVEGLYTPIARLSLGARYDTISEKGKERANSLGLMVRYNMLVNAFAMAEYGRLSDDGHITGSNEDEETLGLFLVALF